MLHFADRLLAACKAKGSPICVGLDPVYEKLPAELLERDDLSDMADGDCTEMERRALAIHDYCSEVIRAVAAHVPCVKLQSACFERYRTVGCEIFHSLIEQARDAGLIVISDVKRNDIGISAEHYAAGCLSDPKKKWLSEEEPAVGPDAVTINSYLGADGVEPFTKVAAAEGKGVFALVRTSNPSGDAIQSLLLQNGDTVAQAMARLIAKLGGSDVGWAPPTNEGAGTAAVGSAHPTGSGATPSSGLLGKSGYSLLGAVVGATKVADAARLRELMPRQIFLVPGFGAQGGKADDVRACFNSDGQGAIITASRSVIFAYEKDKDGPWQKAVEKAAIEMKKEVNAVMG